MARVSEIRYVGYAVPDLEAERRFYADVWGLTEVASEDGLAYFAAAGAPEKYVVRLRQAAEKRVDLIAWAAETRADVDALHAQVLAADGRIIAPPHALETLGGGYGFRFFDLDGRAMEISAEVEAGPFRTLVRGEAIPVKISHVVLHSPDHKAAVAWYERALGFKVSDWLGDFMCFMRCNSWHHRLAFLPGPPCLNHVAYDVLTVDDMMRGVARLKRNAFDIQWGPGRHTAGNNTFSYFVTPAGNIVEYTSELEAVDDEAWVATVRKPSAEVMDQWGVGVGGPQTMPHPVADHGLWQAPAL
ncbi:VOC family protein [Caulobacter sp. UNC279MFTsu5.1]|uniref:VOC family protein n=1 Tax=Caulobacter sp. UNC279MFTsu5.1 TaxID=1502775 RepID=UPI0003712F3D|nr:VOC family protein [Caulobacter sp. UNC279MFTsu5.1]SFK40106.1 Predicted lactoylglutathione lyase [Caulobacter sp. UNC279MFTsu5.1]